MPIAILVQWHTVLEPIFNPFDPQKKILSISGYVLSKKFINISSVGALGWSQWTSPVEWVEEKTSKLNTHRFLLKTSFQFNYSIFLLLLVPRLAFVTWLCVCSLILIWMHWTYIWDIQQRWSLSVRMLCSLLLSSSNSIYKMCKFVVFWLYFTLLMMIRNAPGLWAFYTPIVRFPLQLLLPSIS